MPLDTWVRKVPRQEPSDTDSTVCDDGLAETTTPDASQLNTSLQRDIEGKKACLLFIMCVNIHLLVIKESPVLCGFEICLRF